MLDILERWGGPVEEGAGRPHCVCLDELYLLAKRPIPPLEFYEDFPQMKTVVWACCATFRTSLDWGLGGSGAARRSQKGDHPHRRGRLRLPEQPCLTELRRKCHNIIVDLVPVHNDFFGGTVNVTGLLTGQDLLKNLKGRDLATRCFWPPA